MNEGKTIIECLLFASNEPLSVSKIREVVENLSAKQVEAHIHEINEEYASLKKPYEIYKIADGYLVRTKESYSTYIEQLYKKKRGERLSQAGAEVLAIVAYKQPVTRAQIDEIRGVDSSGIIANLMDRELIQIVGKLEVPGRPSVYGVTKQFLQHFGLSSIQELPKLEEIE